MLENCLAVIYQGTEITIKIMFICACWDSNLRLAMVVLNM